MILLAPDLIATTRAFRQPAVGEVLELQRQKYVVTRVADAREDGLVIVYLEATC